MLIKVTLFDIKTSILLLIHFVHLPKEYFFILGIKLKYE